MRAISKDRRLRIIKENLQAWVLLAPSIIIMLIFTVYPILRSIYLSLTNYSFGMEAPVFIGIQNYVNLFKSALFWKVMGNTFVFALMTVIPSMVIGLLLALLVNRKGKHIGFLRTSFFYPAIMPMIAVASIWLFIYMARNGLFDQLLIKFGMEPMNVLSSTSKVLPAMAVMYVWKEAGFLMVFFLSGLQSISEELTEAAQIDGANYWTTFRKIILPLLGPTMLFVSTVALTNTFKLVDHVVIMTEGGPNNSSTMLLYYIYQQGFTNFNYGVSSTLTVIMLIILLIFSLPRFLNQDKKVFYN